MWKVSAPMKRLSSMVWPLGIVAALTFALAPGCTTHGEGGRCDPNNVNQTTGGFADCDATNSNGVPLVCVSGTTLSLPEGGIVQGYVCCPDPAHRDQATTDICKGNPISPGSDASIPDTGTTETGTSDATSDQSTSDVVTDSQTSDVVTDSSSDGPTE